MAIAANTSQAGLGGLARRLILENLITEEQAKDVQNAASREETPFVTALVDSGLLASLHIAEAASREFGVPMFDLNAMDMTQAPLKDVSQKLISKHHVLPLYKRGKHLFIALSDPTNLQALEEIRFQAGCATDPILVEEDKLGQRIEEALKTIDSADMGLSEEDLGDLEGLDFEGKDEKESDNLAETSEDDAPVVRFINKVLTDAVKSGASDIHFEPYEKQYRVRLRQDGVLREMTTPPSKLAPRLASRLKVMSRLDVAERRVPQDGRIKLNLSKTQAIDFRVSTCPTLFGEKIVLRILDPSSAKMGIDALGYEDEQRQLFMDAIHKPTGMVLVTGPTGSGKTVSLYTAMNILNTEDRNISTAEDPAEINLPGINQVNVKPDIGLDFASCLRAFLRQDPDVVMVGEIRDLETAEISIKAAQTGHMVLSTLHTNDAPKTLTRLLNMGVPAYNIASSVSLIIAQRLARRLCQECCVKADIPEQELVKTGFDESEIKNLTIYEANEEGCRQCSGGYKGRTGVYQVMPVTEKMGEIIMAGGNSDDLKKEAAANGVTDLRRSGLKKVREGVTSLTEINRVTID